MAFDPSLREDILKQVDIVKVISYYQPVIKKGREYWQSISWPHGKVGVQFCGYNRI